MSSVTCARCGKEGEGLPKPPFPGELGLKVHASVCAECWKAWLGEQTIVMNERRLKLNSPDHRALVIGMMRAFLKLE